MNFRLFRFVSFLVLSALLSPVCIEAVSAADPTTLPSGTPLKKVTYPLYVHQRVLAVLNQIGDDHDYPTAISALKSLFDQTILFAPDDRLDCIREADFARRLVNQLSRVPAQDRDELLPFLRKHENLAQTIAFLIRPDHEKPATVYELLNKLRKQRPEQIDNFASLAAAICVVHNTPLSQNVNENQATAADPIDIFDYYVRNEKSMFFGIRSVPAELLLYVVDTTASVDEMQWALNKYAGTRDVGSLFFDIKYDYDYLQSGKSKTLTVNGFNLPNILKYGGVCIDQAYFAATVGKSIGVPTAIDIGASGEASHAWVGFLQFNGKNGFWNFDTGRYESYQGVCGNVRDPQIRSDIPDCYVTLLGETIGTRTVDRQNAVALTDAAERLGKLKENPSDNDVNAPSPDGVLKSTFSARPRATDAAAELDLIELSLRHSVAYTPAWFTVRELAVTNQLTLDQKRRWSDVLIRLGAAKYPDFTLSVLMPMVKSVEDPDQQDALLSHLLLLFQSRMDLSAAIRMTQASLWESHDQSERAGQCYMDVVQRYSNDGPFVLDALKGAEKLLITTNRGNNVVLLYQQAWSRTTKPGDWAPEFIAESNWFKIGNMYADKLSEAGNTAKAAEVKATLETKSNNAAGG